LEFIKLEKLIPKVHKRLVKITKLVY